MDNVFWCTLLANIISGPQRTLYKKKECSSRPFISIRKRNGDGFVTEVKRKRMMGRRWGPTCWEEVAVLFRVSSSDLLDMSSACRAWSCSNWAFSYSCTYMRIGTCKTSKLWIHQAEGVCLCVCVCPTCWLVVSWAAFNLSCISFFTFSTSSWAAWATVIWRVTSAFCETHRHVQFSTEPRLLADPVLFPRTWHPLSDVSVVGSERAAEWERVWWQPLSVAEEHSAKFHLCKKWNRVCR